MIVWCLLLGVLLLPVGGISVDLWHAVSSEQALQAAASDAAVAGASGIDVAEYRASGRVVLDPSRAASLVLANLADQSGLPKLSAPPSITVSGDGSEITVVLHENMSLTLMRIVEGNRPMAITASGSSAARASGAPR